MLKSAYSCIKIPPANHLAGYIDYMYSLEGPALVDNQIEPWFPSGTMDLIIDLGSPFEQGTMTGEVKRRPQAFTTGLFEQGVKIRPTGEVHQLGIVFKPGKFRYFIKGDQEEFKGAVVPLREVFGPKSDHMVDQVLNTARVDKQFKVIHLFLEKAFRSEQKENYFIDHCVNQMLKRRGNVSVHDFALKAKTSDRHFRRIFKEYVGISPKLYCMMIRLQSLVKLTLGSSMNLSNLAYELGYFDPAHLSRDFKQITGICARDFVHSGDFIAKVFAADPS